MHPTRVLIRDGALAALPAELPDAPARFVVTDGNVEPLLPAALARLPRHVLPPGEAAKSWDSLGALLEALAAASLDRDAQLLAVGGGVVTDVGGLAAALHRRGIRWCAIPTTLIGMLDAAHGGKTAVNAGGAKNGVGVFHAPELVLVDPTVLASLPAEELRCGLVEALKAAVIAGDALLADVESCEPADFAGGGARAGALIARCLAVKQLLVARDPRDDGARQKLNLGHTFGHAFESLSLQAAARMRAADACSPVRAMRHGEAVGLGLLCAARLAVLTGAEPGLEQRLAATLRRWNLPTHGMFSPEGVLSTLRHDKKRRAEGLLFILPDAPGHLRLLRAPDPALVQQALQAIAR
ncbi:MAG TPA: 3-dehydroquinate synthase family protein [Planctomycetota bacterium]|nr:3-dehydroquinate synthase family protein [Planctomycetota bacterium]